MVSEQITDAVTQGNVRVVAESPTMAMGSIYQTSAHSIGLLFENTVNAQNQLSTLSQTACTQAIMSIMSLYNTSDKDEAGEKDKS